MNPKRFFFVNPNFFTKISHGKNPRDLNFTETFQFNRGKTFKVI
jgi:ribosomal protein L24E